MTADLYRARAEELRRIAARTDDPAVKAEYLKLAKGWEDLARSTDTSHQTPKPER
jgi:hypothetical protein